MAAAVEDVQVKQEPVEAVDLESRIIELCRQIPKGITDQVIQNDMPQFDAQQRVMAINRLLSTGKIDLLKSGNQLIYKLKDPGAASKVKGADHQEKVVYQIIEEAGNKGQTVAATNFPLYCIRILDDKHFVVAGGGGQAKTGVANAFEIHEMHQTDGMFVVEKVFSYDTGNQAVMNMAVGQYGKDFVLTTGQDDYCQVYHLKYKISSPTKSNGSKSGEKVRKRKGNGDTSEQKSGEKLVSFGVEKGPKTRTDFSKDGGFQKAVAISRDSSIVATAGADGFLRVWNTSSMKKLYEVNAHKSEIDDTDISPSGSRIVTASRDGHARVWNTKDGKSIGELLWKQRTDIKYRVRNCRFGIVIDKKDEGRLYTTHIPSTRGRKPDSCYLTKWNADSLKPEKTVDTGKEILSALAVSDEGIYTGLGTISGSVYVYISFSLQKLYSVTGAHQIFVTGLDFANSSTACKAVTGYADFSLFSISADNKVKIHQMAPRALWSPLWAVFAFCIIIYLAFWLLAALGI